MLYVVIRTHDGPKSLVFSDVYTPYSVLINMFTVIVDKPS